MKNTKVNNNYSDFYEKITAGIRRTGYGVRILEITNRVLTLFMYVLYPVMNAGLLLSGFLSGGIREAILRVLPYCLIPSSSFFLLTIIRDRLNWKRPYEEHDIRPLLQKDTKGHSMPSRHVFSCAVIAMCVLTLNRPAGVLCLLFALLLSVIRILGGVHYPRDVITGLIIGLLAGSLLFFFI